MNGVPSLSSQVDGIVDALREFTKPGSPFAILCSKLQSPAALYSPVETVEREFIGDCESPVFDATSAARTLSTLAAAQRTQQAMTDRQAFRARALEICRDKGLDDLASKIARLG